MVARVQPAGNVRFRTSNQTTNCLRCSCEHAKCNSCHHPQAPHPTVGLHPRPANVSSSALPRWPSSLPPVTITSAGPKTGPRSAATNPPHAPRPFSTPLVAPPTFTIGNSGGSVGVPPAVRGILPHTLLRMPRQKYLLAHHGLPASPSFHRKLPRPRIPNKVTALPTFVLARSQLPV